MKTATAKMQFATALLLASLAVQSLAMPLDPNWDSKVGQGHKTQPLHQRSKRSATIISNYTLEVFGLREPWKQSGCNETYYNCAPVTPSYCTDDSVYFYCQDEVRTDAYGCELNFTVLVEEGESTEGAELALYKKAEPDTGSHVGYVVFILYKKIGEQFYATVPAERYIPSSCKSWQVFDISSIKDDLPVGVHKFNLLVAVFKETDFEQDATIMTCSEAKSLFVMDTSADIHEFQGTEASRPEPENETGADSEVDENGNEKLSKDKNINETDQDNETELEEVGVSGSGGGEDLVATTTTSTPPIVEDSVKVEDFLPTLAVIVSGSPDPLPLLTKRSAIEQNIQDLTTPVEEQAVEDSEESSGANCRLLENKVHLPTLDPNILYPNEILDIGKCSDSTDTVQCNATTKNLDVIQKPEPGLAAKVGIRYDYITTECTAIPLSTTEDSMSSGSISPQNEMVTEAAGTAAADLDEGASGGTIAATNSSLLENKTDLSTTSPNTPTQGP